MIASGQSKNWSKGPRRREPFRFSLRGLFYATTFVAVFAAILNNPFGSVARMITAQLIAMFLLAVCILSFRDIRRRRKYGVQSRMDWIALGGLLCADDVVDRSNDNCSDATEAGRTQLNNFPTT